MPEYSKAGGHSDEVKELSTLPRAKDMLSAAADIAKERSAYVAINVLENRNEKIKTAATYLTWKVKVL